MPEVRITIGGRDFDVACQEGEEHYLRAAARMLDTEATVLIGQIGRIPELRMLLMAGLMLADKTAGLEDQVRAAEERAVMAERALERARAAAPAAPRPPAVDNGTMSAMVAHALSQIAERTEALAAEAEARLVA
jgi:cell division protein ZapA